MKKVKTMKNWSIYEMSEKERIEYGFNFTVIHAELKGLIGLSPQDSDWECESLEMAIEWVECY